MLRILVLMNTLTMDARDKLADLLGRLERDDRGATIIEYSLLIGLITVAVVATVGVVAAWIANRWNTVCTTISGGC